MLQLTEKQILFYFFCLKFSVLSFASSQGAAINNTKQRVFITDWMAGKWSLVSNLTLTKTYLPRTLFLNRLFLFLVLWVERGSRQQRANMNECCRTCGGTVARCALGVMVRITWRNGPEPFLVFVTDRLMSEIRQQSHGWHCDLKRVVLIWMLHRRSRQSSNKYSKCLFFFFQLKDTFLSVAPVGQHNSSSSSALSSSESTRTNNLKSCTTHTNYSVE